MPRVTLSLCTVCAGLVALNRPLMIAMGEKEPACIHLRVQKATPPKFGDDGRLAIIREGIKTARAELDNAERKIVDRSLGATDIALQAVGEAITYTRDRLTD